MLVVTRKKDERLIIGNEIEIQVLRIGRDNVRLGIKATVLDDRPAGRVLAKGKLLAPLLNHLEERFGIVMRMQVKFHAV